jgi:hypothetical protein
MKKTEEERQFACKTAESAATGLRKIAFQSTNIAAVCFLKYVAVS